MTVGCWNPTFRLLWNNEIPFKHGEPLGRLCFVNILWWASVVNGARCRCYPEQCFILLLCGVFTELFTDVTAGGWKYTMVVIGCWLGHFRTGWFLLHCYIVFPGVLVSWDWFKLPHQSRWLKTTDTYCVGIQEISRSLKSGRAAQPLNALGKCSSLSGPSFCWLPWFVLECYTLNLNVFTACVSCLGPQYDGIGSWWNFKAVVQVGESLAIEEDCGHIFLPLWLPVHRWAVLSCPVS